MLRGATTTAIALCVHTAINARLLRRSPVPAVSEDTASPAVSGDTASPAVSEATAASSTIAAARAPTPTPTPTGWRVVTPVVSVLVPARDEADRIAGCVRALTATGGEVAEILVLDDRSEDATAAVVRAAAGGDRRVRVLTGRTPPAGWLGKPWACAQLAAAASGDVLVFVDADVVVAPGAVAATAALLDTGVSWATRDGVTSDGLISDHGSRGTGDSTTDRARGDRLDLACPYPRQLADGVVGRLVQPLLQWSWLTFLPLRLAENSRWPSLTAANGQLLACTATGYAAAGGHAAVRGDVLEDLALARAFKRAGLRAGVTDGTDLATCRMYTSAADLVAGYTKSLWAAFGPPGPAAAVAALLVWIYVLPPAVLVAAMRRGDRDSARVAGLGYAAGVAGRMIAAARTGGRPADGMAHPASIVALVLLTGLSHVRKRTGTLRWRGRPVAIDRAPEDGGSDEHWRQP